MTVSLDLIQSFKNDYYSRLTPQTIVIYQKAVKQLLAYHDKSPVDVTPRDIRNWLSHLETNGYQTNTRNTRLAGVKLFYRYCVEEGYIPKDPTKSIQLSKVEEKLPYYLRMDQLEQLRQIMKGKLFERAVIETLYTTGVRVGELVAMKKEDIDWSERSILIPNGKRKKARIVLFTRYCKEHLRMYLQTRQDDLPFLFINSYGTNPVSIRTIQLRFKYYAEQLEISFTPHTLRHTFAAHLAVKGMPLDCIQILLGHEEAEQTQYYARLYDHARKEKYDQWM